NRSTSDPSDARRHREGHPGGAGKAQCVLEGAGVAVVAEVIAGYKKCATMDISNRILEKRNTYLLIISDFLDGRVAYIYVLPVLLKTRHHETEFYFQLLINNKYKQNGTIRLLQKERAT